jgi:hypothetical protein
MFPPPGFSVLASRCTEGPLYIWMPTINSLAAQPQVVILFVKKHCTTLHTLKSKKKIEENLILDLSVICICSRLKNKHEKLSRILGTLWTSCTAVYVACTHLLDILSQLTFGSTATYLGDLYPLISNIWRTISGLSDTDYPEDNLLQKIPTVICSIWLNR